MMVKRDSRLRRDLNELLLYRDGVVEHSKLWSNVGCVIVAYWMISVPERVWTDWVASIAISSSLIAPDIVRKLINMKNGAAEKEKT